MGVEGVINPFFAVVFVLPVLVPPKDGLKESLGKPETLSLRHLFDKGGRGGGWGVHRIVAYKQVVT